MRTLTVNNQDVESQWYLVDACDLILGRLATRIAHYLRGKHKVAYSPHLNIGDHIVVINAEKIRLTGSKERNKIYYHHTGYPGGIKQISAKELLEKHPERVLEKAVRGMLPRNSLGRSMLKKLKIYVGPSHPHKAQKFQEFPIDEDVKRVSNRAVARG